jgi:hypothetical protein
LADLHLDLARPVESRLPSPTLASIVVPTAVSTVPLFILLSAAVAAVPLLFLFAAAAVSVVAAVFLTTVLALGRNADREHANGRCRQNSIKNALSRHKTSPLVKKTISAFRFGNHRSIRLTLLFNVTRPSAAAHIVHHPTIS